MKNRIAFCAFTALCVLLSGCSRPQVPDGEIGMSSVSDPMNKVDSTIENTGAQHKSHTYGFKFTEESIIYEDGKLGLALILKGAKESTTAGFLVFIDGVLQKYSVSGSTEKSYMSQFDTVPNGEKGIALTIDAVLDEGLEEHNICVCSMLCPDFRPTDDFPQFGFYHNILDSQPCKLSTDNLKYTLAEYKSVHLENTVLTKSQRDKYHQGDDENGNAYVRAFELTQTGNESNRNDKFTLRDGETSLELSFVSCSSQPYTMDQRVTFYKNHLPCKFNGGYDFLEITTEGGKISETKVTIDDVRIGDVIYCIAAPLGDDIVCNAEKSKSCIVVGTKGGSAPNEATNLPQNLTAAGIELEKSKPVFSMGDTMYFVDSSGFSPDTQSGILFCSSKNGKDIDKTIEIGTAIPKAHGEYISLLCSEGDDIFAKLYDKELNEVKSVKLNDILGENIMFEEISPNIDFDGSKIVYVSDFGELCSCDWNLDNRKTLMTLPCSEAPSASAFTAVCISGEKIAFTANGQSGSNRQNYYGICGLDGNYEIRRKDNIDAPQANDEYIVWSDCHVAFGELPSGKIETYKDGKFETVNTAEQGESQYAFLGDNSFLTFNGNGNVLRKYKDGKTSEFPLEQGEHGVTAVEFGGKIFVESYGADNKNKTYSIEVN